MTNQEWMDYYQKSELDIPQEITSYCEESFTMDDDLFFIYAAKMYFAMKTYAL